MSARRPPRYAIRVTYATGDAAFLRHGARIGFGSIVQYPNRRAAAAALDFIRAGLDARTTAQIVTLRESDA